MTVSELATECHVTPNSIRKWLIRHHIPKQLNAHTRQLEYDIDEETRQAIIKHYEDKANGVPQTQTPTPSIANTQTLAPENDSVIEVLRQQNDDLHKTIDLLTSQIQTLTEQLAVKDSQIQVLSDALAREQQALSQQQTLHALTMQADSEADAGEPTAMEQAEEPTEKKRGFFSRFKKSK